MNLKAGAGARKITPTDKQFLCGYPHVERYSDGVDTELFSSALFLDDGSTRLLFIGDDLLYLDKRSVALIRSSIAAKLDIPPGNIMVSCTHTHSGPVTTTSLSGKGGGAPQPDPAYLALVVEQICAAALEAAGSARPAELGLALADSSQVGGNRRDPDGPKNPDVPVLAVREPSTGRPIALMFATSVHPTVLHQDSTLVSADYPGHARAFLQERLGPIPVVALTGPAGDQSPRYLARANTVAEAGRLGRLLGGSVLGALAAARFGGQVRLGCANAEIELLFNVFPSVEEASGRERAALDRFERLRRDKADHGAVRGAECDWFGAERRLDLARLNASGELERFARARCMPAEVQVLGVGPWRFAAWPGEIFVDFALRLRRQFPNAFPVAYANGETMGYLVTAAAVAEGGYEAAGASYKSPESPEAILAATARLLAALAADA